MDSIFFYSLISVEMKAMCQYTQNTVSSGITLLSHDVTVLYRVRRRFRGTERNSTFRLDGGMVTHGYRSEPLHRNAAWRALAEIEFVLVHRDKGRPIPIVSSPYETIVAIICHKSSFRRPLLDVGVPVDIKYAAPATCDIMRNHQEMISR